MRHLYCRNVFQFGLLMVLSGATAACGTPGNEGEPIGSETAELTTLPAPRLSGCSTNYDSGLSMYLAPYNFCLVWTNLEPAPQAG